MSISQAAQEGAEAGQEADSAQLSKAQLKRLKKKAAAAAGGEPAANGAAADPAAANGVPAAAGGGGGGGGAAPEPAGADAEDSGDEEDGPEAEGTEGAEGAAKKKKKKKCEWSAVAGQPLAAQHDASARPPAPPCLTPCSQEEEGWWRRRRRRRGAHAADGAALGARQAALPQRHLPGGRVAVLQGGVSAQAGEGERQGMDAGAAGAAAGQAC